MHRERDALPHAHALLRHSKQGVLLLLHPTQRSQQHNAALLLLLLLAAAAAVLPPPPLLLPLHALDNVAVIQRTQQLHLIHDALQAGGQAGGREGRTVG